MNPLIDYHNTAYSRRQFFRKSGMGLGMAALGTLLGRQSLSRGPQLLQAGIQTQVLAFQLLVQVLLSLQQRNGLGLELIQGSQVRSRLLAML